MTVDRQRSSRTRSTSPTSSTGILFILGLRFLSSPKTARLGNRISAVGMLIAVVATLTQGIVNWIVVGAALLVGAVVGIVSAQRVKMTAMPQMVAIFNGAGGGAAALVAAGELLKYVNSGTPITYDVSFTSVLSGRDRRAVVRGLDHRVPQAARGDDRAADHVSRRSRSSTR